MLTRLAIRNAVTAGVAVLLAIQLSGATQAWGAAQAEKKAEKKTEKPAGKLDLNSATEQELQELPGVGAAYAKKIIAARPLKKVSDLSKAGIPEATIEKIKPLVTVKTPDSSEKSAKSAAKVNLNTATEEELQALPGIGAASAKKLIAGRPLNSPLK